MLRRTTTALLALALSLVLAAPASAALIDKVLNDFADGTLNPCTYTEQQLSQVKDFIAADADAYQPDLRTAIDAMIEQRAQGACDKNKKKTPSPQGSGSTGTAAPPAAGGTSGTPPPAGGETAAPGAVQATPGPAAPTTAAPLIATDAIASAARARDEAETPPVPVIVLAVAGVLLALAGLLFSALRWTGWQPRWAERVRHAIGEAGWRASTSWAEFTDFVRFGR